MVLIDTNVLLDLFTADETWGEWSGFQLRAQSQVHRLAINPIIYAEISLTFDSVSILDDTLKTLQVEMHEIPRPALFLAARAHVHYRRKGGIKGKILADFLVGAHAAVTDMTVITRDGDRYRSYFPGVSIIAPPKH